MFEYCRYKMLKDKGEKVFTSRVFPEKHQNGIQLKSGEPTGKYFELKY